MALVLTACSGGGDSGFTDATRAQFIERCTTSGDETYAYCNCAFRLISEGLTRSEYDALLRADQDGMGYPGLPDEMEGKARTTLAAVDAECR